jgi:hypothetical protein
MRGRLIGRTRGFVAARGCGGVGCTPVCTMCNQGPCFVLPPRSGGGGPEGVGGGLVGNAPSSK